MPILPSALSCYYLLVSGVFCVRKCSESCLVTRKLTSNHLLSAIWQRPVWRLHRYRGSVSYRGALAPGALYLARHRAVTCERAARLLRGLNRRPGDDDAEVVAASRELSLCRPRLAGPLLFPSCVRLLRSVRPCLKARSEGVVPISDDFVVGPLQRGVVALRRAAGRRRCFAVGP